MQQRFASAVAESAVNGTIAIVDHGLALTLYASSVVSIDAVSFWDGLTFPDAWVVADEAISRLWGGAPAPDQT